jgi:hypothetical protein
MHHSQKPNGLVCGLSTRNVRTPCSIQNSKTLGELVPERAPVVRLEVERVDVLVLLRRVLRVLDGAVRPRAEPLRVLLDVRVVGRDLERDVERDLDAAARAASRRAGGSPRACRAPGAPPCGRPPRADGPRAADTSPAPPSRGCCGPCASRGRWDGSAAGRACRSRAPRRSRGVARRRRTCRAARLRRGGAGEQLVPGAEAGALRLDQHLELAVVARGVLQVGVARDEVVELVVHDEPDPLRDVDAPRPARARATARACFASRPARGRRRLEQLAADDEVDAHVLVRGEPLLHVAAPALERVEPRLERVAVAAELLDREAARQRSLPRNSIGASRQRRSFSWRESSRADSASWPSVKMSASTTSSSPTTRLHGNRPPSISGCTPSMMTRRLSRPLRPSFAAIAFPRLSDPAHPANASAPRIRSRRARGARAAAATQDSRVPACRRPAAAGYTAARHRAAQSAATLRRDSCTTPETEEEKCMRRIG